MTIAECYKKTGGDYENVLSRFLNREELVKKFSAKFLEDNNYAVLCSAIEQNNREEAFRAAHTLKGISMNLGYERLYQAAAELTEALRTEWQENADILFEKVSEEYQNTVSAVQEFLSTGE